jgi:hypothetical protein
MPVAKFLLPLFGFGPRVGTVPSFPNNGAGIGVRFGRGFLGNGAIVYGYVPDKISGQFFSLQFGCLGSGFVLPG